MGSWSPDEQRKEMRRKSSRVSIGSSHRSPVGKRRTWTLGRRERVQKARRKNDILGKKTSSRLPLTRFRATAWLISTGGPVAGSQQVVWCAGPRALHRDARAQLTLAQRCAVRFENLSRSTHPSLEQKIKHTATPTRRWSGARFVPRIEVQVPFFTSPTFCNLWCDENQ